MTGPRSYFPAMLLLSVSVLIMTSALFQPPDRTRQIGLVFPPGSTVTDVMVWADAADARVIRLGFNETVSIVDLGQERETASIPLGKAWFLVNPIAAGGCLSLLGRSPAKLRI